MSISQGNAKTSPEQSPCSEKSHDRPARQEAKGLGRASRAHMLPSLAGTAPPSPRHKPGTAEARERPCPGLSANRRWQKAACPSQPDSRRDAALYWKEPLAPEQLITRVFGREAGPRHILPTPTSPEDSYLQLGASPGPGQPASRAVLAAPDRTPGSRPRKPPPGPEGAVTRVHRTERCGFRPNGGRPRGTAAEPGCPSEAAWTRRLACQGRLTPGNHPLQGRFLG